MRTTEEKFRINTNRRSLLTQLMDEVDLGQFLKRISPELHDDALSAIYYMYGQIIRWC